MLLNFKITFLLAQLYIFNSTSGHRSGYAYFASIHGWLKLHQTPANWLAARVSCHSEGAFLASPWTVDFSRAVIALQSPDNSTEDAIPAVYSGVHVTFAEGAFSNVTGEAAISLEPSGLMKLARCKVWYSNGSMGDVSCNERLPYVCYALSSSAALDPTSTSTPVSASMSSTVSAPAPVYALTRQSRNKIMCGVHSLGYEFANQTERCYKFHAQAARWRDANRTCVMEGAHLAIPNSRVETKALTALFARYPKAKIHNAADANCLAVGIYFDSDVWKTVSGQTLNQVGYAKWVPGLVGNKNRYRYVFMCRSGEIRNFTNVFRRPFICEKAPLGSNDVPNNY